MRPTPSQADKAGPDMGVQLGGYSLEYSEDGQTWRMVQEKYHCADAPVGSPFRRRPIIRERLQDIQREAEFHSHRYPHVRIIHPKPQVSA